MERMPCCPRRRLRTTLLPSATRARCPAALSDARASVAEGRRACFCTEMFQMELYTLCPVRLFSKVNVSKSQGWDGTRPGNTYQSQVGPRVRTFARKTISGILAGPGLRLGSHGGVWGCGTFGVVGSPPGIAAGTYDTCILLLLLI